MSRKHYKFWTRYFYRISEFWNIFLTFALFGGPNEICTLKFKKFTVISCGSYYLTLIIVSVCVPTNTVFVTDVASVVPWQRYDFTKHFMSLVFFDFVIFTAFYVAINIAKNVKIEYNLAETAVSLILKYSGHIAYYNITIMFLINNYCKHFICNP